MVNHKQVQRLWQEEGQKRPAPHKKTRAKKATGSVRRHQAKHQHQLWAMDFHFDVTAASRRLKCLNIIDELRVCAEPSTSDDTAGPKTWRRCQGDHHRLAISGIRKQR